MRTIVELLNQLTCHAGETPVQLVGRIVIGEGDAQVVIQGETEGEPVTDPAPEVPEEQEEKKPRRGFGRR